jgi:hypothetical protein
MMVTDLQRLWCGVCAGIERKAELLGSHTMQLVHAERVHGLDAVVIECVPDLCLGHVVMMCARAVGSMRKPCSALRSTVVLSLQKSRRMCASRQEKPAKEHGTPCLLLFKNWKVLKSLKHVAARVCKFGFTIKKHLLLRPVVLDQADEHFPLSVELGLIAVKNISGADRRTGCH